MELLSASIPPALFAGMNCSSKLKYIALNYWGSKPTWQDGRTAGTFSYFEIYEPLINHPLLWMPLTKAEANLGHDDSEPTHSLMLDTEANRFAIAPLDEAMKLIAEQPKPPIEPTSVAFSVSLEAFVNELSSEEHFAAMRRSGMFEMFGPPVMQREGGEMLQELDDQLTKEFVVEYLESFAGAIKFNAYQIMQVTLGRIRDNLAESLN